MGLGKTVISGGMSQAEYEEILQRNREEQSRLEEERRIAAEEREARRIEQEQTRLQEQKQEEIRLEDELEKAERELMRELESQQQERQQDGLAIDFFGSLMKGISSGRTTSTDTER
jgi:hypothetical protein